MFFFIFFYLFFFLFSFFCFFFFFFQAEDGIRDLTVTGVQTCALPICVAVGLGRATGKCSADPRVIRRPRRGLRRRAGRREQQLQPFLTRHPYGHRYLRFRSRVRVRQGRRAVRVLHRRRRDVCGRDVVDRALPPAGDVQRGQDDIQLHRSS